MNKTLSPWTFLLAATLFMTSCRNGSVDHISATRLVILQPVPLVEKRFDENFKAMLELLYPHVCHDTAFIQEQVFLERIDLKVPYRREFIVPASLLRDFFGSNNPDKKQALREEIFYFSDSAFEKNPDKQFLAGSPLDSTGQSKAIGDYLTRNRNNALVYLVSTDTTRKHYQTGGVSREVHTDLARLNCRIVADLRTKTREELVKTTVILVIIPPERMDTTEQADIVRNLETPAAPVDRATRHARRGGAVLQCPPDSVITRTNNQHHSIITEFRNLLHYIATTSDDADLKGKYKEDAYIQIHRIPLVTIEGIPGQDLRKFLNSGFTSSVTVSPVTDPCRMIVGVRITAK